jgi:hypothetical protein
MRGAAGVLASDPGGGSGVLTAPRSRRKVRREAVVRLVELAPFPRVDRTQGWRRGLALDLSPRGLCLRAEEPAAVGSLLHVLVRDVDGRPFLDAVARVVWSSTGSARTGLEIVARRGGRPPARLRLADARPAASHPDR